MSNVWTGHCPACCQHCLHNEYAKHICKQPTSDTAATVDIKDYYTQKMADGFAKHKDDEVAELYGVEETSQGELRQQLAAIEHQRWSDWMEYMFDCAVKSGTDEGIGYRTAGWPKEQYDHWIRQIETDYEDLSDREKASDMEQVDRYWPLIEKLIEDEKRKARAELLTTLIREPKLFESAHSTAKSVTAISDISTQDFAKQWLETLDAAQANHKEQD